jgi:hypothetical protein
MLKTDEIFMFVIVTRPQPQGVTRTYYVAKDGALTKMSWQAAKFLSYTHAKQFAKENRIALNAATYISRESITDLQFQT